MIKRMLLAAALSASIASSANAALVINGGFEDGPATGGTFTTLFAGDTSITGWEVTAGSIDYIGGYWQAAGGTHSIDLAGVSLGTISQTISTIAGQWYEVSFFVSKNPDGGADERTGTVSFDGTILPFAYSAPTSLADMNWVEYTYQFLATDSSTILSFAADPTAGCCYGPALDEVAVAAVPEPSTWAMLLLGFGAVGYGLRRRRSQLAQLA